MRVAAKYPTGASVRQRILAVFLLLIIFDRWRDSASHHDYGIINMYRVLEIESQQEPPAKPITRTHYDGCLMRFASVSTRETLGRARDG